jgi:hypothetical protein
MGKIEQAKALLEESLKCVQNIDSDWRKNGAIKTISVELAKQGNWQLAENLGLEIHRSAQRHICWKEMAENAIERVGHSESLGIYNVLNNKEARSFYLKGWVENLQTTSISMEIARKALYLLEEDINSTRHILELHALNQLFFEEITEEKIQRFNRTLNIQWAIDIKNQLPN